MWRFFVEWGSVLAIIETFFQNEQSGVPRQAPLDSMPGENEVSLYENVSSAVNRESKLPPSPKNESK
jgi:hypothetical protein